MPVYGSDGMNYIPANVKNNEVNMDPYKVLGVSPSATDDEVKKAYRRLSRKYHPDANVNKSKQEQEAAEENFKKVQMAYDTIVKMRSGKGTSNGYGSNGYYGGYGNSGSQGNYGGGYSGNSGNSGNSGGYGGFGGNWWDAFGFGGGYSTNYADEARKWGDDQTSQRLRAAINYTSAGSYNEALNILNNINERDARWYFVMSFVQSGLGNNSAALENAAKAKQMDPDNETYNNLYRQLYGGGAGYANTGRQYGRKGGMNQAFLCLPAAVCVGINACSMLGGGRMGYTFCC